MVPDHVVEAVSDGDASLQPTPDESGHRTFLRAIDRTVGHLVDAVGGLLVLAEIVVLLVGVVSRYYFHSPLVWTDEVSSTLFLWLAMVGSVIALRRTSHMRMTALVDKAGPSLRAFLDTLGIVVPGLFLLIIMWPAFEFAQGELDIQMPTLGISNVWRASALPVGVGLMLLATMIQLGIATNGRRVVLAAVTVAVIAGGLYALQPFLLELGSWNLVIFFVAVLMGVVFMGVPIAFSFGIATIGYLALSTTVQPIVVVSRMDEGMSNFILLAVPMFVFLGALLELTSMAKVMVRFLASLLGHFRGGLDYVLIGAMYLVSGISGSKAADMAAVAPVLIPEMRARGSKDGEMLALIAATGAQTETVPPSIVLITIGSVCSVSIAALFTGGLLPSFVCGLLLAATAWWRARKSAAAESARAKWSTVGRAFLLAVPALALPFVIRSAVIEGIATATEVSTIGIAYCLIVGALLYRQLPLQRLWPALVDTAALSGTILLIIGTASGMAWSLTQSGFSTQLATAMSHISGGSAGFIVVSIIAFTILGSVLEGIPAIVVFGPLLFPIARQFGINDVHYSMIAVLSMGIGLFAPPFGVGYYSACAICRIHPSAGMKPIAAYMGAVAVGVMLVAAIPWLSTSFL
ncbi:TRAP transporter large permease subunit [Caballeronia sp. J97]|uniref:TRAP transporter large permease n=1 Tax=Caballeronia sp. J97 TaxID=2805429 RepID=UPI0039EE6C9D